jgi:hypothetical protein
VALPPAGSTDVAEHSKSDVLFWSDQLSEHGLFFAMLLPGAEAKQLRQQSLTFQQQFAQHYADVEAATVDDQNFQDINTQTTEMVKPFVDFKLQLEESLSTGEVRGLVWPSFAAHVAAEGEHFLTRLSTLNGGDIEFDLAELVPFWSRIMGEHALFAAHLLDPVHEQDLSAQARELAATFQEVGASEDAAGLAAAGEMILDFKEDAETGIENGEIQSIIHPALADHIRREAVKFLDELDRATGTAGEEAPATTTAETSTATAAETPGTTAAEAPATTAAQAPGTTAAEAPATTEATTTTT